MNEYTLPLGSPENFWRVDGREIPLMLLPKEEWKDWEIIGDSVMIGTHENVESHYIAAYPNIEFHALHYTDHALVDLPNDFITAPDLKRLGINLVERDVIVTVHDSVVDPSMAASMDTAQTG